MGKVVDLETYPAVQPAVGAPFRDVASAH